MEKQTERQCRANAVFTDEAYLKTRYVSHEDGTYTIRVGRGERRDVLACKELYGKAVKTALELDCTAKPFAAHNLSGVDLRVPIARQVVDGVVAVCGLENARQNLKGSFHAGGHFLILSHSGPPLRPRR